LGLQEYVASLQGHEHVQAYTERSLIDTGETSTTRRTCLPQLTSAVPPGLNLNIIIMYSQPINGVEKSKVKLFPSNDETIIRQPLQTKHY
jgi:hypothetical protein